MNWHSYNESANFSFMRLEPRREAILKAIVDEYIRSAQPVGSRLIAEISGSQVSPATIRGEMAALEEAGYIAAPHTSAGRIPTEKAYVYYLQNFVSVEPGHAASDQLRKSVADGRSTGDGDPDMRDIARTLMELSGEMAIVAVDPRNSYYSGVANLVGKPDFSDLAVVKELSRMLDRFDDVMGEVFDRVASEPQVMIGGDSPFGKDMSAIMVKCRLPNGQIGILGLIGPMRMDYGRNLGLVTDIQEILDDNV